MLKALSVVFYTECLLLLRRSHEWLYPVGFFLILIALFPLAYSPEIMLLKKLMPGCVWMAALFSSVLSIEHVFATEIEEGHFEQVLLSGMPLSFYLAVKLLVHWLVAQVPLILLTPVLGALFQMPGKEIWVLCLSLLFGTPVLTLMGSLGVALTLGLRQQGMLLGLLMLPLVVPVLIFGVNVVRQAGEGFGVVGPVMFLFGVMVLAVTVMPGVIGAVLRMGLED